MGFLDKAKDLLSQNADKVETAIDKAGDFVDDKTQGKYSDTIHKVQEEAKKAAARPPRATSRAERTWRNSPDPSTYRCRPEQAWKHASDLSRYKEWLTIHRVWRSKLPEVLEKGTVIESYRRGQGHAQPDQMDDRALQAAGRHDAQR